MRRLKAGWMMMAALCLVLAIGFPAWAADVIKIGVIGPMNFMQGKGHWNGATMAAEEINAKGGVQVGQKKMKIELVKADSNEFINITDATNAMERLMTQNKVDFVSVGSGQRRSWPCRTLPWITRRSLSAAVRRIRELCLRVAKDYNKYKYFFRGTPFNSTFLGQTSFIHLGTVGAILKKSSKPTPGQDRRGRGKGRLD